ncbi:hypothetical protein [Candidatus Borrarchaeum sp.]|uniref:hypothetical protein n=1 Tax=Candidatus Borrarchaeum sp. TaxID=2846742 RepID=UPI00257A69CA|nr:hypothetical protein [Candidatus Borrarchaeum sp.]
MNSLRESLKIKVIFSKEEIEIFKNLLEGRKEIRPLKKILEEKITEYQLGLIYNAKVILNDACPSCGSLNTKEDHNRPPTLTKGGNFIIYRQCCECNTKFSAHFIPSFEADYSI